VIGPAGETGRETCGDGGGEGGDPHGVDGAEAVHAPGGVVDDPGEQDQSRGVIGVTEDGVVAARQGPGDRSRHLTGGGGRAREAEHQRYCTWAVHGTTSGDPVGDVCVDDVLASGAPTRIGCAKTCARSEDTFLSKLSSLEDTSVLQRTEGMQDGESPPRTR